MLKRLTKPGFDPSLNVLEQGEQFLPPSSILMAQGSLSIISIVEIHIYAPNYSNTRTCVSKKCRIMQAIQG
jgi:hypothetical protein